VRVDRLAYRSGPPRRGDVVVFHHVRASDSEPGALAKRVIAVAGDHVAMTGSRPVVNGHELATCDAGALIYFGARQVSRGRLTVEWLDGRPYLTVYEPGPHSFAGYDVKPGEVFVLGDNRGVSNDSRSWPGSPAVSLDQIEGRVERVLLGDDRAGRLDGDRLWYALGTDLQLPGVDVTPLRAGIEHCLREPPPPWR
jgi:signal peptidase I